jgi:hypothetical protein
MCAISSHPKFRAIQVTIEVHSMGTVKVQISLKWLMLGFKSWRLLNTEHEGGEKTDKGTKKGLGARGEKYKCEQ